MKRAPDWAARLHSFVDDMRGRPFDWSWDCGVGLAGGAVLAQTGVDIVAELRGRHDSAAGAMRTMKELGVDDLAEAVALYLEPYEHPSQAQMGDIAAVPSDGPFGCGLGIVNGETVIVWTEEGLGWLPRSVIVRAYRVG